MAAAAPASIDLLRRQLAAPARGLGAVLPFGDARIDGHLPGGGLPVGQVHEIGAEGPQARTGAAVGGFAAVLAGALARQEGSRHEGSRQEGGGRVLLWVGPRCELYAPGLLQYGIDPGRLIVVQTGTDGQTLQAMETALRSGAASVVLGEVDALPRLAARRLQLACMGSHGPDPDSVGQGMDTGSTALLLRRRPADGGAATRWCVAALPSQDAGGPAGGRAPGLLTAPPRWHVRLLHARGGRSGSWIMELDDAAHPLRVVAVLGDDAAVARPERRRAG